MKISRYLYALSALPMLMLSEAAMAKIGPKAFKEITKHFKSGKEHYSPTLGQAALESGLIHDLRFYGNFESHVHDDKRLYIKDSSSDPLWNLLKTLFPSPAGHLATQVGSSLNFGKHVKDPFVVALLLNFANEYRNHIQRSEDHLQTKKKLTEENKTTIEKINKLQKELKSLNASLTKNKKSIQTIQSGKPENFEVQLKELTTQNQLLDQQIAAKKKEKGELSTGNTMQLLSQLREDEKKEIESIHRKKDEYSQKILGNLNLKEESKKDFDSHRTLLDNIEKSIKQEKGSLYPKYTTEQVISAFFCEKFNTQKDILELLRHLDSDIIVDAKAIPTDENYLTIEDLSLIANKQQLDLDDLYALENAYIFNLITPYKPGVSLLSNGDCYFYDRKGDTLKKDSTFPDCAEIASRHLMNLLLFNGEKKGFDLTHIKAYVDTKNPYFKNFEDFYAQQAPNSANAGDVDTRSLWNKVVGDLNDFDDPIKINYMKNTNELNPGFINFIRTFQKILGLKLEDFPEGTLEEKKTWIETSLQTLFQALNPNQAYAIDLSDLQETEEDISGNAIVTVKDSKTNAGLFSFTFYSKYKVHSEIRNLKILQKVETGNYNQILKTHPTALKDKTAEESLWLLADKEVGSKKIHHPLYALFNTPLADNNSRIEALERLNQHFDEWQKPEVALPLSKNLPVLNKIVEHLVANIGWEDPDVLKRGSPILVDLLEKKVFDETLSKTVKTLEFSWSNFKKIDGLEKLVHLEKLHLPMTRSLEELDLKNNVMLEELNLYQSSIKKIEGLEKLVHLKKLNLAMTLSLEKLDLKGNPDLEDLDLRCAKIKKIEGLEKLVHLKTLDLRRTDSFEELDLKNNVMLEKLNLYQSSIKKIEGLEKLAHLKKLNLKMTSSLEGLDLKGNLDLEGLDLGYSKIKKIEGLENLVHLKKLDLYDTKDLKDLSVKGNVNLETLNLSGSMVKTIAVENSSQHMQIDLRRVKDLETFSLVGNAAVKALDFSASKLKSIKLRDCTSLERLNLLNTRMYGMGSSTVEDVELENIPQLKNLNLGYTPYLKTLFIKDLSMLEWAHIFSESSVKKIHFENLDALTELNLSSLQNLEEVVFKGSFANLKQINFNKSEKLHEIEGLENKEMFPNLKNIIITNTPELTDFKKAALKEKYESVEVEVPQVSQTSPHSSPRHSPYNSSDEGSNENWGDD